MMRNLCQRLRRAAGVCLALTAATAIPMAAGGFAVAAPVPRHYRQARLDTTPPVSDGLLTAVSAAPGTTQAWAVGNEQGFALCAGGFALNYADGSWSSSASGLATDASLNAVAAVSASQVWVAGGVYPKKSCFTKSEPFLAYYSGATFRASSLKGLDLGHAVLNGLSAASSTDVWAVGLTQVKPLSATSPVVLQWNGIHWSQVAIPVALGQGVGLFAVSAVSPSDVWVAGYSYTTGNGVVLQWNGTTWTENSPPPSGAPLTGIAASASGLVWVVGMNGNATSQSSAYSAQWNSASWAMMAVPANSINLASVTMSGTSAWAAGETFVKAHSDRAVPEILYSADGGAWQSQRPPDPSASTSGINQSGFTGISAASARFAAAVGQNGIECGTGDNSFADIYNGTAWHATPKAAGAPATASAMPDCGG
jgi:uncharacterized protein YjbI with pentapeptide repeats